MSIWNIEEYKPRPTQAQPHLNAAYLLDKERNLPDLEAGFRVQSSDQAWVPQPSYLYLVNNARLERADQYAWGPQYESFLQTRIDQNEGYVCPLDSMSERDIRYNLDGFPMNQPPLAPNKAYVREPETVKKGESIGEKRKADSTQEEKPSKKGIPSRDILSEQLGETTKKEEAPFGYFPDVSFKNLQKESFENLKEEMKHAGPETLKMYEKLLKMKKLEKEAAMKEETVESVKLDESKADYDPLDEAEKANVSATSNLDAEMMKNIDAFKMGIDSKKQEQKKMEEKLIYDVEYPMRSQEYKRLFSTPKNPTTPIERILYGPFTPKASDSQQGKIFTGNNQTPIQPEGKRNTVLNSFASISENPRSGVKTPRALLFSEFDEEKSYSPPLTPAKFGLGAQYSPEFPRTPESILVSPKQQTPTPKRPQVIQSPLISTPKAKEQTTPVTPTAKNGQTSTPSTDEVKNMKLFRPLQDIARGYGVKGTSYEQLKKKLEEQGLWLDAKQKLKPFMK